MNAMTPGGLTADSTTLPPKAHDDHVRLTDDDEPFGDRAAPFGADPSPSRGKRAARADAVPPHLSGIEVRLSVEVGGLRLSLKDLMEVEPGQLFALDKMTAEPVSVLVNGKVFARGEIVAVGERFGVRLTEISGGAG